MTGTLLSRSSSLAWSNGMNLDALQATATLTTSASFSENEISLSETNPVPEPASLASLAPAAGALCRKTKHLAHGGGSG